MLGMHDLEPDTWALLCVVGSVLVLSVLASHAFRPSDSACSDVGRTLLDQSSEWVRLADGTAVPLHQYRHTCFALAYINAARLVSSPDTLRKSGIDPDRLAAHLEKRLVALSKTITKACPTTNPAKEKTSSLSWVT